MSLYRPFFTISEAENKLVLAHNCNWGIGFTATQELDRDTHRLIVLAIEEGKRRKAMGIRTLLEI